MTFADYVERIGSLLVPENVRIRAEPYSFERFSESGGLRVAGGDGGRVEEVLVEQHFDGDSGGLCRGGEARELDGFWEGNRI